MGPLVTVELNGQEFLRFRGIDRPDELAREFWETDYGVLMFSFAVEPYANQDPGKQPLWARALTKDPGDYSSWDPEPFEDWRRQAGLLDLAVGLLGLLKSPQTRRSLRAALSQVPPLGSGRRTFDEILAEQEAAASDAATWPVRSLLGGAARARLVCEGLIRDQRWAKGRDASIEYASFQAWDWRISGDHREKTASMLASHLDFTLDPAGIAGALAKLLNAWLEERVRAAVIAGDGVIRPAQRLSGGLLAYFWLQLANAALAEVAPRRCAWERCPGPPSRPGVFLWRWGRTATGIKHKDALYCHPLCQHAAAVAKSRRDRRQYDAAHGRRK